jgi:hypothetical protein
MCRAADLLSTSAFGFNTRIDIFALFFFFTKTMRGWGEICDGVLSYGSLIDLSTKTLADEKQRKQARWN